MCCQRHAIEYKAKVPSICWDSGLEGYNGRTGSSIGFDVYYIGMGFGRDRRVENEFSS
jgi:hypothetical protein